MNNLSIRITSPHEETIYNLRSYWGEIRIGNFRETIYVPVEYWNRQDYEKQWAEGIQRISTHSKSCLIATIQGYKGKPGLVNWWLLYKKDGKIFIQNQFLIEKSLKEILKDQIFTPESCYKFIPRKSISKKVSEWVISADEIR